MKLILTPLSPPHVGKTFCVPQNRSIYISLLRHSVLQVSKHSSPVVTTNKHFSGLWISVREQECLTSTFSVGPWIHMSVISSAGDWSAAILCDGRVGRSTESTERMTTSDVVNWVSQILRKLNKLMFFFCPYEEFAVYLVDWIILTQRQSS